MFRIEFVAVVVAVVSFSAIACSETNPAAAEYEPSECECEQLDGGSATEPQFAWAGFAAANASPAPSGQSESTRKSTDDELEAGMEVFADGAKAKEKSGPLTGVLNINEASRNQLMMLPGIGPAYAERILSYREKRRFEAASHLKRIKGIGDATFEKLSKFVRVDGDTTLSH